MNDQAFSYANIAALYPARQLMTALGRVLGLSYSALLDTSLGAYLDPEGPPPSLQDSPHGWGITLQGVSGGALFLGLYLGEESVLPKIPDLYLRLDPPEGPDAEAIQKKRSLLEALCVQLTDPQAGIFWGFSSADDGALWAVMSLVDAARTPDAEQTCIRYFEHCLNAVERLNLGLIFLGGGASSTEGDSDWESDWDNEEDSDGAAPDKERE